MSSKLAVLVLGNRNSGKSTTWYKLFDENIRTGKNVRSLYLTKSHYVNDVYVINGSPEERKIHVSDLLDGKNPDIVLCSTQYIEENSTLDFFIENGYDIYVQWLNPGRNDNIKCNDDLEIVNKALNGGSVFSVRDGKIDPEGRINEIREFIFGWASFRNLINTEY